MHLFKNMQLRGTFSLCLLATVAVSIVGCSSVVGQGTKVRVRLPITGLNGDVDDLTQSKEFSVLASVR